MRRIGCGPMRPTLWLTPKHSSSARWSSHRRAEYRLCPVFHRTELSCSYLHGTDSHPQRHLRTRMPQQLAHPPRHDRWRTASHLCGWPRLVSGVGQARTTVVAQRRGEHSCQRKALAWRRTRQLVRSFSYARARRERQQRMA